MSYPVWENLVWVEDRGSSSKTKTQSIRGVMILQILDLITFSIQRSWFDSIFTFIFFKAQVAMPFLD